MNITSTNDREALAKGLPDIPRWLEARSLLLSRECQIFGYDRNAKELAFVVTDPDLDPICVIGFPDPSAITMATSNSRETTVVLATLENQNHMAQTLPDWRAEPAILHTLAETSRLPDFSQYDIRLVSKAELDIPSMPGSLRQELQHACEYSPVAAVFVDNAPVSFCYAGSQTETLWDISIDTLDSRRRQGYAGVCVSFLIEHMRKAGKEPVWGALESNDASMKLAEKLGFKAVDRLIVFERDESIPIVDVAALVARAGDRHAVAHEIGRACREYGFFYIRNHGISNELQGTLESLSRAFFEQDLDTRMQIHMSRGGRAWRGYFPVGEELTSGAPDLKEGIYFGAELGSEDPRVKNGLLMHGPNLFPSELPEFRQTVVDYIDAMTQLAHRIMEGISLSLGLPEGYFAENYTADPFVLFRIFNYPASDCEEGWGVAEHTDYGLLTILKQDKTGGLEVKVGTEWIAAPPVDGTFVCNIGDMLDKMTGGMYRSTPHRVKNTSGRDRLSFPFFFDPGFDARVGPILARELKDDRDERWDHSSVHEFGGTYGEYLLGKVAKVFPVLRETTEHTDEKTEDTEV